MKSILLIALLSLGACANTQQPKIDAYTAQRSREIEAQENRAAPVLTPSAARCLTDADCSYWTAMSHVGDDTLRGSPGYVTVVNVPTYRYVDPVFTKHGQWVSSSTNVVVGRP